MKRRRWILAATVVFFVVAGGVGGGVAEKLSNGGFQDPNAESSRAARALDREFGAVSPNIVLLVSTDGSVDDPEIVRHGRELTKELMRLAGRANWWAPSWMRKMHQRFGISESDPHDGDVLGGLPAEGSAS